jgi:23S rRNA pseudouridine1911/1915/1917 synthase
VTKEYRAICRGVIQRDGDFIETHLRVNPRRREKMMVCEPHGNSREAVTQYEVLRRFVGFTFVRLLPRTGRTHQLRVHLAHLGHPIIADALYGGGKEFRRAAACGLAPDSPDVILISRQALHAYRLEFTHPTTGKPLRFEAPLPQDMQRTLDALAESE